MPKSRSRSSSRVSGKQRLLGGSAAKAAAAGKAAAGKAAAGKAAEAAAAVAASDKPSSSPSLGAAGKKLGRSTDPGKGKGIDSVKIGKFPFGSVFFGFLPPFLFFLGYFIKHKRMDDSALGIDEGDRTEDDREDVRDDLTWMKKMWQKFSIRQRMLIVIIGLVYWVAAGWFMPLHWEIWWKLISFVMISTAIVSILFDQGRGSAYIYLRDNVWPQSGAPPEEMKQTCIEWGCGYYPHNEIEANVKCDANTKGKNVREYK